MLIVNSFAQGYHWKFDEILRLTETQIAMISHAAWVSSERDEEQRRREKICFACGNETVGFDKICSECGAQNGDVQEVSAQDRFIWKDKVYIGDTEMTAQRRFQVEDPKGFSEWMTGFFPTD